MTHTGSNRRGRRLPAGLLSAVALAPFLWHWPMAAQIAPCQSGVQLTSLTAGVTTYNSGSYLSASGSVNVNTDGNGGATGSSLVTFQAGTAICLGPGFQAAANGGNSGFVAVIASPLQISTSSLPAGYIAASYNQALAATGGVAPYTWAVVSGSLPTGLLLSSSGAISGYPSAAGSFPAYFQVTDSSFQQQTVSTSIIVAAPITFSPTSGAQLSQSGAATTIAVTLATPTESWSVNPQNCSFCTVTQSAGSQSGTITVTAPQNNALSRSGTINLVSSQTNPNSYTLTVPVSQVGVPVLTMSAQVPAAFTSTIYSATFTAGGGAPPYTWSISSGTLPGGWTAVASGTNSGTYTISGTPSAVGQLALTVKAQDTNGSNSQSLSQPVTITTQNPITITNSPVPISVNGGTAGSISVNTAAGGVTWSASTASCSSNPCWLTFTPSSGTGPGVVSLAAAANATSSPQTASVVISSGGYSLTVPTISQDGKLTITTTALPAGFAGALYSGTVSVVGGAQPSSYTYTFGNLPAGISWNGTQFTGTLSSASAGTYTVPVTVVDNTSPGQTASSSISLAVYNPFTLSATAITGAPAVDGGAGSIIVTGNGSPSGWTATAACQNSPCWISVNPASGPASGATSATISVVAPNTALAPRTDQITFKSGAYTVVVPATQLGASPPQILTTALPTSYYYAPYSQTISATGGTPPYSFSVTNYSTGQAGWSMTAQGQLTNNLPAAAVTVTVQVVDANNQIGTAVIPIANISAISRVGGWGTTPPAAGGPFGTLTYNTVAPGATYTISFDPINPTTFFITEGSNTAHLLGNEQWSGQHTFTLQFTANLTGGSITEGFITTVYPWSGPSGANQYENATFYQASEVLPLTIPSGQQLPPAYLGVTYSGILAGNGGSPPYSWNALTTGLPPGLAVNASGYITGTVTPTDSTSSSYLFTPTIAHDSSQPSGSCTGSCAPQQSITVNAPFTWTVSTTSVPAGGGSVSPIAVTLAPYMPAWSVTSISSCGSPCWLSGAPSMSTSGPVTLTAGQNTGGTRTATVQIQCGTYISPPITVTQAGAPGSVSISSVQMPANGSATATYSGSLSASGGTAPYSWSLTAGSATPPGLSLAVSGSNYTLSGTPTTSGVYTFTVGVSDASSPPQTASQDITVTIAPFATFSPSTIAPLPSAGASVNIMVNLANHTVSSSATFPGWASSGSSYSGTTGAIVLVAGPNAGQSPLTGDITITSSGSPSPLTIPVSQNGLSPAGLTLSKEYMRLGSRVIAVDTH